MRSPSATTGPMAGGHLRRWLAALCILIGCFSPASCFSRRASLEMGLETFVEKTEQEASGAAFDRDVGPPAPSQSLACPTNNKSVVDRSTGGYFPSSPFDIPVFTQPYQQPPLLPVSASHADSQDPSRWIDAFEIEVTTIQKQLAPPPYPKTNFLGYNGMSPGPTIQTQRGRQSVIRFKNNIQGYFNKEKWAGSTFGINKTLQTRCGDGLRPILVHNHGHPSIPPFDGWAEDVICYGQFKDYVYPNSDIGTYWYHDHTIDITAENTYYGLAGMNIVRSFSREKNCPEPFNLQDIPEKLMIMQDKLLDQNAQLFFDRDSSKTWAPPNPGGYHTTNFYGDINLVNGVPFPYDNVQPRQYLFRFLVTGPSRPYTIQIVDSKNTPVQDSICWIVAPDQGIRGQPVKMPKGGLPIGVAERYSVLCDFTTLPNQDLYVVNSIKTPLNVAVPFFCHSHLIMRITVSGEVRDYPRANFSKDPRTSFPATFTEENLAAAQRLTTPTRTFNLAVGGGKWTIANEGWKNPNDKYHVSKAATDVGVNTWEVWQITSNGAWFHPIHVHLVRFYVLQRNGAKAEAYETDDTLRSAKDVAFWHPTGAGGGSGTLDIAARFGPFKGYYMFHCHNTVHEDNDMMRDFQTVRGGKNAANALRNTDKMDPYSPTNTDWTRPDSITALSTDAPPFTAAYLQSIFDSRYYAILYPRANEADISNSSINPWIAPQEGDCTA